MITVHKDSDKTRETQDFPQETQSSHTKNGQYQLVILPSTFSPDGGSLSVKCLGQFPQASLPGQTGISLLHGLYESLWRLVGGQ